MPKFVDYAGRYAFFEEAAFTIVRDEGVHRLSRHRVAAVLGTSISTIRRVVGPRADLRCLALREVEQRRLVGRRGPLAERFAVAMHGYVPEGHGVQDEPADDRTAQDPIAAAVITRAVTWPTSAADPAVPVRRRGRARPSAPRAAR